MATEVKAPKAPKTPKVQQPLNVRVGDQLKKAVLGQKISVEELQGLALADEG